MPRWASRPSVSILYQVNESADQALGVGAARGNNMQLLENARNVITVRDVVQDAYHNFMPAYQVT